MDSIPVYKKLAVFVVILAGIQMPLFGQMTQELKEFLWEKDFTEMLSDYGEERVILSDSGDYRRRLALRTYREERGLRIQTFAGADLKNAENMMSQLTDLQLDSVYLVKEEGLYKVQLGNFLYRVDAEKMLDRLRFAGISNAWIVETIIHLPKDIPEDSTRVAPPPVADLEQQILYAIQIFVSRDFQRAEDFSNRLNLRLSDQSWILQSGEFWKVLIGRYQDEASARQRLSEIRDAGYADAWLTQINK
jgi:hypothetical protein